ETSEGAELTRILIRIEALLPSSSSPRKFASTDEIREVTSPFKCTALEDLLGRARIREVDFIRKKNNEKKELNRKQAKSAGRKEGGTDKRTSKKKMKGGGPKSEDKGRLVA
ncbi:hypothetical protein Tco_0690660, partial [Tanacetum coccineum]